MAPNIGIYQNTQPNLAMGLGDIVNNYVNQNQADAERQNRLVQMAQQDQIQNLQLQQARQQQADEAKLRQAYQESGGDMSQMAQKLRSQGLHAQADQVVQAQIAQQKAKFEIAGLRHEGISSAAIRVANNPGAYSDVLDAAVKEGSLHPDDAAMLKQKYSILPADQIKTAAQADAVSSKDASKAVAAQLYPSKNPEKWSDRNGNMWFTGPDQKPQPVIDPTTGKQMKAPLTKEQVGNKPTFNAELGGYVYPPSAENPQGKFVPVVGTKKPEKPLTDFQGKAYSYGTRALDAHKVLNDVGTNYSPMATNVAASLDSVPGLSSVANSMLSDKDQQVMQAQRNFINAVLRQESGAAIATSEFTNAQKQYFPQPGDTPSVIAQKKANRERVISNFKTEAGPAASKFEIQPEEISATSGQAKQTASSPANTTGSHQAQPTPKIGDVLYGHVFLGGDPSNPNSWKPQ